MKVMVCLLDRDTDIFVIVVGILQGDTLAPFIFIMCPRTNNVNISNKNAFPLTKKKKG